MVGGDIITDLGPLESTGGKVWEASLRFLDFVRDVPELSRPGSRILELGSGCGWLGMSLAKERPDLEVVLSEQFSFGALDWLRHNIELNPGVIVKAIELDWASVPADVCRQGWDLIIGSELVYSYAGAKLLPALIAKLLVPSKAIFYYAHTMNRFESVDDCMFDQFVENGLKVETVFGKDHLERETGSFSTLFPDLELVILRITIP